MEIGGIGGTSRLSVNALVSALQMRSFETTHTRQVQIERSGASQR